MKAREIIEDVKMRGVGLEEDALYDALEVLEKDICRYGEFEEREFGEDAELYAPKEYKEMYTEYLVREAALRREDWDCYNAHNTLFNAKLKEYRAYIVRNAIPKEQSFKNNWRW